MIYPGPGGWYRREAHLSRIIKVHLPVELFSYDIERGFKVLKSEIEIGPVYHRLLERIRAHASICFMALILHRIMRARLRAAAPLCGVSSISTDQSQALSALGVRKPVVSQQLALL